MSHEKGIYFPDRESLAREINNITCYYDLSAELIADAIFNNKEITTRLSQTEIDVIEEYQRQIAEELLTHECDKGQLVSAAISHATLAAKWKDEAACSLVEENETLKRRIAEQREYYEGVIADGSKRIAELESKNGYLRTIAHEQNELAIRANLDSNNDTVEMDRLRKRITELERSETQLINERDDAESALNNAYKAVMGQAPEWSNWFGFENAIDEIELACELWRNQTDDVIQFRQRIQELEAKLANPVLLPKTNGYWNEQEKAYEEAITLAKRQVRLAGFSVEDM